jgi:hypothetical protein
LTRLEVALLTWFEFEEERQRSSISLLTLITTDQKSCHVFLDQEEVERRKQRSWSFYKSGY